MEFSEYQARAKTTAIYPGKGEFAGLAYCGLGIAGEAGEAANQVKKVLRDDGTTRSPERKLKIAHEIGDTLWYCAQLATELGLSLEDIADANLRTLAERADSGRLTGEGWARGKKMPDRPPHGSPIKP